MKKLLFIIPWLLLPLASAAECIKNGQAVPCSELTGFFVGLGLFFFIFMAVGLAGSVFWIFMLIDCAKRNFKKSDDKLVWILLIVLLHFLGAVIYYFVVKKKDKK